MKTGRRVWNCELSTIDSAFLFAGMLAARHVLRPRRCGREARSACSADELYERADWNWALDGRRHGHARLATGRRLHPVPVGGYDEALLLYLLGLGSPTLPAARRELRRVPLQLSVEEGLRLRVRLLRAALHAPALASVGRLPGDPGRLHARARHATTSRTAGTRRTCSSGTRSGTRSSSRATASSAGGSRRATAPAESGEAEGRRAELLRLRRTRRALRARRRDHRPLGRGRLAAVRARDRAARRSGISTG